jgi:hypothetical protein
MTSENTVTTAAVTTAAVTHAADTPRMILSVGSAAFLVYFCMYAFRKPFTVGLFDEVDVWGFDYKIILILSQVLGYACSKFIGITVISVMLRRQRAFMILGLVAASELALLGFALVDAPYNIVFLFLNGLPLGMIWGVVFSYIEGRRTTELLAVILSASFIMSSGITKSVGKYLMVNMQVSEYWMPFATGALFVLPMIFAVWWLEQTPVVSMQDQLLRHKREPMSRKDRRALFFGIWPGMIALVVMYFILTAFRDYRDNFAADIWSEIGMAQNVRVFAQTEIIIAVISLAIMASLFFVRNNIRAVKLVLLLMIAGLVLLGAGTYFYQQAILQDPFVWMVLIGLGAYVAYIPMGSILFERIIASLRYRSNAGFLIYIADTAGYAGSILLLLYKEFFFHDSSVMDFFILFSYATAGVGIVSLLFCYRYFDLRMRASARLGEAIGVTQTARV